MKLIGDSGDTVWNAIRNLAVLSAMKRNSLNAYPAP